MVELRLLAGDTEPEGRSRCYHLTPCDAPPPPLQLDEAARLELGDPHQHPRRDSESDVGHEHAAEVATPPDSALFCPRLETECLRFRERERLEPGCHRGEAVEEGGEWDDGRSRGWSLGGWSRARGHVAR